MTHMWTRLVPWSLLVLTADAWANMGIPMLALAWPAHWAALLPVIAVEGFIGQRTARMPIGHALKVSAFANLWSTFIGVPVVWAALFAVEVVLGIGLSQIDPVWGNHWLLFPLSAAWLGPDADVWQVYLAFVILAVPFCIGSIWIETRVALRMCPTHAPATIRSWMRRANFWSYVLLVSVAVAFPVMGQEFQRNDAFERGRQPAWPRSGLVGHDGKDNQAESARGCGVLQGYERTACCNIQALWVRAGGRGRWAAES